jgi:hypothetical protein
MLPDGGVLGTATGVLDLNDGLEAVDTIGVVARSLLAKVCAGAMASLRSSIQSNSTS